VATIRRPHAFGYGGSRKLWSVGLVISAACTQLPPTRTVRCADVTRSADRPTTDERQPQITRAQVPQPEALVPQQVRSNWSSPVLDPRSADWPQSEFDKIAAFLGYPSGTFPRYRTRWLTPLSIDDSSTSQSAWLLRRCEGDLCRDALVVNTKYRRYGRSKLTAYTVPEFDSGIDLATSLEFIPRSPDAVPPGNLYQLRVVRGAEQILFCLWYQDPESSYIVARFPEDPGAQTQCRDKFLEPVTRPN
jgi:hypothetical protein